MSNGFAPRQDGFATKSAVAAQDDPGLRTTLPDRGHNFGQRLDRAVAGIAVGGAQLGPHERVADERIQWQS